MDKQRITIIGIGMGDSGNMTGTGKALLSGAGLVTGAGRMLEACGLQEGSTEERDVIRAYEPEKICRALKNSQKKEAAVLMSGDSGFYSGTKKLLEALENYREEVKEWREVSVYVEPGISSLSYFASRLQISWDDAALISLHGRKDNLLSAVKRSRKTFLLTGGQTSEICRELTEGGLGDVMVCAGSRLSYPDEHIVKCPAKDWQAADIPSGQEDSLTVLFLLNEKPERFLMTGIPEECFVRGQVPMTKSEVRAVIMSKLAVREDDVIYDIGAGTGSVSVELALAAGRGQVFAVECDPEGISLIRQNGEKFGCHNLTAVEGMAPEALTGLPAPDAVFIGGTKGRLDPILDAIPGKNGSVRICISAVTMETVSQAIQCMEKKNVRNMDACQIGVTRLRPVGGLHMLQAQNPIFLLWGDMTV